MERDNWQESLASIIRLVSEETGADLSGASYFGYAIRDADGTENVSVVLSEEFDRSELNLH